jgi:hypothetical protein
MSSTWLRTASLQDHLWPALNPLTTTQRSCRKGSTQTMLARDPTHDISNKGKFGERKIMIRKKINIYSSSLLFKDIQK